MYKVERAIIMAAGKGQRMQPVTFHTPKPLIKVNGVRMIDTIIRALHTNGIYEIYVVVGYLKEQFNVLLDEYEGIHICQLPRILHLKKLILCSLHKMSFFLSPLQLSDQR